ncbi:MAG: hypothetical protein RL095_185 [Verrucomicrobiota bacterium]|jgi:hypothetical protein
MRSIFAIVLMFVAMSASAQITVKTTSGESVDGKEVKLEAGRLKLTLEGGAARSWDRSALKQVIMAEPADMAQIRKLFYSGKFADVVAMKPKADGLKLFGWGKWAAYFIARAHIALGKADEGRKILREFESSVDGSNVSADSMIIKLGLAETDIAMKKNTEAESFLLAATNKYDDSVRPYVSAARGRLYFAQEKFENSKLEHLKVVLCDPNEWESRLSLKEIDVILKKLQDPRAGQPLKLSRIQND